MKSFKLMALGVAVSASLFASASASAATWDPQNTPVPGSTTSSVLDDAAGNKVTCTGASVTLTAVGDLATGRPSFSPCTESILGGSATVTTTGTWTYTATSTTSVDATAVNAGGNVAEIVLAGGLCTITVPSPVHIAGNTWSNSAHTLTTNGGVTFPITTDGFCPGVTSPARLTTTFTVPAASIT